MTTEIKLLKKLMAERGFRVESGTYHKIGGEILPTWVIRRKNVPDWGGVYMTWDAKPEMPKDGKVQVLFALCGVAIAEWDRAAFMYEKEGK